MSWKEIKETKWFRYGIEIAIVVAIFAGVLMYQTRSHVDSGEAAPTFDLAVFDADDERVSTDSLQGKPTVLYFWAPWCGVCEASSHNVDDVREAVGDDANVLSVVLEYSSLQSVRDFVERNETNYPVLLGDDSVRDQFSVSAFPTIYVLDSDGRVRSSVVGYTTEIGIRARLWWASI